MSDEVKDEIQHWPLANVVAVDEENIIVRFVDALGKVCSMAVDANGREWESGQEVDLSRRDDGVERSPVKEEKVSIRAEKLYSIRVDGRKMKGLFQERESMSGMKRLVKVGRGDKREVVVDCPDGLMEVLGPLLGDSEDIDVNVVKASSSFVDEMMGNQTEGVE